jgi:predicted DNA-binding transcriptional regulator AlpA
MVTSRLREPPTDGEVFVRAKRLAQMLDVSVATLWRWTNEGRLPRPHRFGPGVTAWKVADVLKALDRPFS